MSHLQSNALLVQLTISQWTARKFDRKATAEVATAAQADYTAGRYNKALLPQAASLEAIRKLAGEIRTEFYRNTLPWAMDGTQILPTRNYMDFTQLIRIYKQEWANLVATFVAEYDAMRVAAAGQLGTLYDPADYPPKEVVEKKFALGVTIMPVPTGDFRVELGDAEVERIRAEVTEQVESAGHQAMQVLWQRLYDAVNHMAEKLATPDAIFRDSLVGNVEEICNILPKLNVLDDANLTKMSEDIRSMLIVGPGELRKNAQARTDTATEARRICDKMSAYMGAYSKEAV